MYGLQKNSRKNKSLRRKNLAKLSPLGSQDVYKRRDDREGLAGAEEVGEEGTDSNKGVCAYRR